MDHDHIMRQISTPAKMVAAARNGKTIAQRSIARAMMAMDWEESQHPRGDGGKFTSKGSGGGSESEGGKAKSKYSGQHKQSRPAQSATDNLKALQRANRSMARECRHRAQEWPKESQERQVYERYAETLSKPLSGRPTPEESKAMTDRFSANISSQLKPAAKERYLLDMANEPQITSDLCDISDQIGAGMFGLDYRLKRASDSSDGSCRIADKIAENMEKAEKKGKPITYEQAVDQLSDMVRYTQACTPENLVENFQATTEALKKKGYMPVKIKNSWDSFSLDRPYRGVNCVFKSPTGTKFELQFHTAESLVGKEVQHGQYEEQRSPRTQENRKQLLSQMMYQNMSSMTVPKNIGKIEPYPPVQD